MLTKPLIHWLLPPHLRSYISDTSDPPSPKDLNFINDFNVPLLLDSNQRGNSGFFSGIVSRHSSLGMLLAAPTSYIHDLWRSFDDSYMRPVFGGRGFVPYIPGSLTIAEEDEHHPSHFQSKQFLFLELVGYCFSIKLEQDLQTLSSTFAFCNQLMTNDQSCAIVNSVSEPKLAWIGTHEFMRSGDFWKNAGDCQHIEVLPLKVFNQFHYRYFSRRLVHTSDPV